MPRSKSRRKSPAELIAHLREYGLARFPGSYTKSPWPEHLDLAVGEKTFAFLSAPGPSASMSIKLPFSGAIALNLPCAQPTGYGLGKSGWVSLQFEGDTDLPPEELLESWLEESYRDRAPKRLIKQLDGGAAPVSPAKKTAKKTTKKKPAKKRSSKR